MLRSALLIAIVGLAAPAARNQVLAADPPPAMAAQELYEAGMKLYVAKQFAAALAKFHAAYLQVPRRDFLFAEAQATRLAGDCSGAVLLYQKFLATGPPMRQVEATRIALARCPSDHAPVPVAAVPVIMAAPASSFVPLPAEQGHRYEAHWYDDRWAGSLTGAGIVLVSAGIAVMAKAAAQSRQASTSVAYDEYARQRGQATTHWQWGLGALLTGVALTTTGVGRYVWLAAGPHQGQLQLEGRF